MAEAFVKMHAASEIRSYSAGSNPSGVINPKAIASMKELGYDLMAHDSKSLDDIPQIQFDVLVGMGCGDKCPFVPAKLRIEWDIPDPKNMDPDQFRMVRDLIEEKVKELLAEL